MISCGSFFYCMGLWGQKIHTIYKIRQNSHTNSAILIQKSNRQEELQMRKWSALCVIVFALILLYGCRNSVQSQPKKTVELPELRIGCDEYEPYNYSDEYGKRIGIDAEIATEACRRMGMKPVFVSIKWDEKDELLEEKQIDCAWNCFSMNDRKDAYQWAGPYLTSREMVVVAKDSSIKSIKDLEGKIVGVQTSTQPEKIFLEEDEEVPDIKFVYSFPDMEDALMVLQQGYVDAVAGHEGTLLRRIKNIKGEYRLLEESLLETDIGVAFSKKADADLVQKLDWVLRDMKEDGTIASIEEKYDVENWR